MSNTWSGGFGAPAAQPGGGLLASLWEQAETASRDELRTARNILIGTGILALLAGVAAIIVPVVASVTMTLFIGWLLMFYGVVSGVHAVRAHVPGRLKAWRILNALLALVVGFYLVALPMSGTITLTFLLAVWFFGSGLFSLTAAWQRRGEPGAGWLAFNGALSAVLGLLIALSLPSSAAWAIGLLVGIHMLWWGLDALMAAGVLKRLLEAGDRAGDERERVAPAH